MRKIALLIILLFSSIQVFPFQQNAKGEINISRGWVFITGDNPDYAKPNFNDKDWKDISVNKAWEEQGYENYDGIGWYRLKIIIPSSIKNANAFIKAVKFTLGKIDDRDDTFLNGIKIGHSEDWTKNREYAVKYDQINWDEENIIAIRVNDTGGGGGMYSGPHNIGTIKVPDILQISSLDSTKLFDSSEKETMITQRIKFSLFNAVEKLSGNLQIKVINNKNKKVVLDELRNITLGNDNNPIFSYNYKVSSGGAYKAFYWFIDDFGKDTTTANALIAYKEIPRLNEKIVNPKVPNKIISQNIPFPYEDIDLEGYLQERLNANLYQRLLNIDETGILDCFYNRPGNQTWVGEYAGKYLHAASRAWRYSHNQQLKKQMDRIVDILIESQKDDGYLGTYLPKNYWKDWDVWAHKYDLLGLLSYYSATNYKPALETCIKIGDLLCKTFGNKKGQLNIIDAGYHVGMAPCSVLEPMTYLYRFTGDKKYLDFCNYIIDSYETENGPKIVSTLLRVGRVDKVANGKAYEMMSNLIGIVKLYQLTDNEKLINAAKIAWDDIAKNRLYITGTSSKGEHFQDNDVFPAENEDHIGEGCVSTTWIQFSQALFDLTGDAKYVDEMEKTIFNHLFAAENPLTGCVSYYTALQGQKPYRCTIDGHCCLASVPRAIAAIPEFVYSKYVDDGFAVNIYSSGEVKDVIRTKEGKEVAFQFSIDSNFPKSGKISIHLNPDKESNFKVALRVPSWCKDFNATIADKQYKGVSGEYLVIEKNWETNSIIDITFDLNTQEFAGGESYPGFVAVKNGTQVLAFDQNLNPEIKNINELKIKSGGYQTRTLRNETTGKLVWLRDL